MVNFEGYIFYHRESNNYVVLDVEKQGPGLGPFPHVFPKDEQTRLYMTKQLGVEAIPVNVNEKPRIYT